MHSRLLLHSTHAFFALLLLLFFAPRFAFAQAKDEQKKDEPKPTAPEAPLEVTVRGRKTDEPTAPKQSIEGREVRIIPGAFGDAFRSLDALPGVTPIVSGLPYFFVRGAPPGNTGFFIDNVRVPG